MESRASLNEYLEALIADNMIFGGETIDLRWSRLYKFKFTYLTFVSYWMVDFHVFGISNVQNCYSYLIQLINQI